MELEENLKKLGLTGNESKVYLELIKRGSISANDLAKKLSFDRTLTYQILNNLIQKGLVNHILKEKKRYFEASAPENLLNSIKEKERLASSIIPNLKSLEKIERTEQDVKVYEGKNGLRVLFTELLNQKNINIFGATGKSYEILKFEIPHLIKEVEEKGLKGKMISNLKFKNHPMTKIKGIKVKYLKKEKSQATTIIYDDKVSIHLLKDKPLIIIIKNKDISDTYKNYFNILWKIAKKV